MEKYETGAGQQINVHDKNIDCIKHNCVIHNPSDHPMKKFKTLWRGDRGLMERICSHGVGHPDPDDIAFKTRLRGNSHGFYESVHGCDGCCAGTIYPHYEDNNGCKR